jgi:hypothetical protein
LTIDSLQISSTSSSVAAAADSCNRPVM